MDGAFYLETYGCALNSADSDFIVGRLMKMGMHRIGGFEDADIIIVNTCGVKEPTEDKIIHRLKHFSQGDTPLIIAGCLPKISLDRILKEIPEFGAIVGPQSVDSLGKIAKSVLEGERGVIHLESDTLSKMRYFEGSDAGAICTIPICEGCLGNCAYCAVKLARSKVKSYSISEIREAVCKAVTLGYKEIRLTSQDAGAYGADTGETLVDLLRDVDQVEGNHRFRIGMFNPNLVIPYLDALLDIIRSSHFFQFFHVPVQSGSDKILRNMKRKYTVEQWSDIVKRIRRVFPRATIATDVIAGFPGESDDDFELTIKLIRDVEPDFVNISKYGDRPGTEATSSRKKVDTLVKKNRSRILTKLTRQITGEKNKSWVGWEGEVLVSSIAPHSGFLSRNFAYKPIIISEEAEIGTFAPIRILSSSRTGLFGEIIPEEQH